MVSDAFLVSYLNATRHILRALLQYLDKKSNTYTSYKIQNQSKAKQKHNCHKFIKYKKNRRVINLDFEVQYCLTLNT